MAKDRERGYVVSGFAESPIRKPLRDPYYEMLYQHGSIRAGLDAITDTTRLAHSLGIPVYAVEYRPPHTLSWPEATKRTAPSLLPYIPRDNIFVKKEWSAFRCGLTRRLREVDCRHLLVIGYSRDCCVLKTVLEAGPLGVMVAASEFCMLHDDSNADRRSSLNEFRGNSIFLPSLAMVWNYLALHRRNGPPAPTWESPVIL